MAAACTAAGEAGGEGGGWGTRNGGLLLGCCTQCAAPRADHDAAGQASLPITQNMGVSWRTRNATAHLWLL